MMQTERDERTVAIENASYRWGYILLMYGLLLITAYRGFVRDEASWDLLALVILGGGFTTLYQSAHRILSRRWWIASAIAVALGLITAVVMVLQRSA